MSFDQDPNESVTISGSDFAEMCDEIKRLTDNQNDLFRVLNILAGVFRAYEWEHFLAANKDKAEKDGQLAVMALKAIAKARENV